MPFNQICILRTEYVLRIPYSVRRTSPFLIRFPAVTSRPLTFIPQDNKEPSLDAARGPPPPRGFLCLWHPQISILSPLGAPMDRIHLDTKFESGPCLASVGLASGRGDASRFQRQTIGFCGGRRLPRGLSVDAEGVVRCISALDGIMYNNGVIEF